MTDEIVADPVQMFTNRLARFLIQLLSMIEPGLKATFAWLRVLTSSTFALTSIGCCSRTSIISLLRWESMTSSKFPCSILPTTVTKSWCPYASELMMKLVPLAIQPSALSLLWHERLCHHPANEWMRSQLLEICSEISDEAKTKMQQGFRP